MALAKLPPIKAKVLIQVEGGEPIEIGEIEIPVEVSVGNTRPTHAPGVRGGDMVPGR